MDRDRRAEGIERVRNTVDVIEEFADYRAPRGGVGKNIIGGEFEAIGKAMLELNRETVVAGAIVGTEKGNVWRVSGQGKS